MVKIRLFRTGTKKKPLYRIVAIESHEKRQGRFLENLGTYDPRGGGGVQLRQEALERWVSHGAQLSDTVRSLYRKVRRSEVDAPPETPPVEKAVEKAVETPAS